MTKLDSAMQIIPLSDGETIILEPSLFRHAAITFQNTQKRKIIQNNRKQVKVKVNKSEC